MSTTKRLTLAALFLALGLVLPFITAQIPTVGSMLLPMHMPIMICGFICGPSLGFIVGLICPILRFVLFGMPPFPNFISMAFELAAYGFICGYIYYQCKKKDLKCLYSALVCAMLLGRLVWGITQAIIYGFMGNKFGLAMFISSAFSNALLGIIIQLIIIPPLVMAIEKLLANHNL